MRVCFVCLGNICRSPTAAAIMRALVADAGLEGEIAVDSAGTGSWHVGAPADRRTAAEARRRGLELHHTARQFKPGDFVHCDLVLAMDADNYTELLQLAPDDAAGRKVHYLREFDPASGSNEPVPDPYYGGDHGFSDVYDICDAACRGLLDELRRTHRL